MNPAPQALLPQAEILDLIHELKDPGQKVYLVGGAVRDQLTGRVSHDLDFVANGNVKRLSKRLADRLQAAFYMLDEERQVSRVIGGVEHSHVLNLDFSALRGNSIEADLFLRDFTVNAIAIDLDAPQRLVDPLKGAQDLRNHVLRMCSPTSFRDDPLRVLRAVRLADRFNLQIEPETRAGLRAAVVLLDRPAMERCRDEVFKIFESQRPYRALMVLDQIGALDVLFPELIATRGVLQSPPHRYNVFEHTLQVVNWLTPLLAALVEDYSEEKGSNLLMGMAVNQLGRFRPQLREHFSTSLAGDRSLKGLLYFSTLYHDVAKPARLKLDENGNTHFFGHDTSGGSLAAERASALALANPEVEHIQRTVVNHMRIHHLARAASDVSRRSIYRYFRDCGSAGVDICLLSLADILGQEGVTINPATWERELGICRRLLTAWFEEQATVVNPPRLVSGNEIMAAFHLSPGRQIGDLIAAIHEAQAAGQVQTAQEALDLAQAILNRSNSDDER